MPSREAPSQFPNEYVNAFDRHRSSDTKRVGIWAERIRAEIGLEQIESFADLGCGVGRFMEPLSKGVRRCLGLDQNSRMIEIARQRGLGNVEWVVGTIEDHNFQDEKFDCVLLSMVLEHVSSAETVFAVVRKLVRQGGMLVVRTMLPSDLHTTTWYGFSDTALSLEVSRTPSVDFFGDVSRLFGFEIVRRSSYVDKVDCKIALQLPDRLASRSFQVLSILSDQELEKAVRAARAAIQQVGWQEMMSASLITMRRTDD